MTIQQDCMSSAAVVDAALDVTTEFCPMTYVRTRLALDRLKPGQTLSVRLRGEDAIRNVQSSAVRHGHAVLSQVAGQDGSVLLLLRKTGA